MISMKHFFKIVRPCRFSSSVTAERIVATKKFRDRSLDMTKGILISFLVIHHIAEVGFRINQINNEVLSIISQFQKPAITCYFMPAFFIITGMVSDFSRPLGSFIYSQFKSLLLPAITFTILFHPFFYVGYASLPYDIFLLFKEGGMHWFLIALFLAKCIFCLLRRVIISQYKLLLVLIVISLFGTFVNHFDLFPNYLMNRQVFDLMLFLGLGNMYKKEIRNINIGVVCICIYSCLILLYYITNHDFPYVTAWFGCYLSNWPFHVILSITGSVSLLTICRKIPVDTLIEYLGRNSLVVYLMQLYLLFVFFNAFGNLFLNNELIPSVFYVIIIFISTIGIGLFTAHVLNNTFLKVLIGKF